MNPAEFRLLIHHHDIAYVGDAGEIWLTAGIARWVSALSHHFKEIGLLLPENRQRLPKQDACVPEKNVKLLSLGPPGHYSDRISRMHRIHEVCRQASTHADGLLIRGLTARQAAVWANTNVAHKAFFLVRSPTQNRFTQISWIDIASALVNKWRELEFRQIARYPQALLMTNSPVYIPEVEHLARKNVLFSPTSTIQESEFVPLQLRPINTPFRLLYCGRIHNLKGLRELLHALVLLNQQGLHCSLDIVGAQEEPGYSHLHALAQQIGINHQIQWHGHVSYGPQLLKFYQSADAFIIPSYTEGFPRVIWEAAANSCPVIATAVGSIPVLVRDCVHALLIPPKNVEAIVSAVHSISTNTALRQEMIKQAYTLAQGFTVEACASTLVNHLKKAWN